MDRILEIEDDSSGKILLDMNLSLEDGQLLVRARSEVLENFFSKLSGGLVEKPSGNGAFLGNCYVPWTKSFKLPGIWFGGGSEPIAISNGAELASGLWLAKVGLKDGIEVKFGSGNTLTTIHAVTLFEHLIEGGLVSFYNSYLKPYTSKLEMSIRKKKS